EALDLRSVGQIDARHHADAVSRRRADRSRTIDDEGVHVTGLLGSEGHRGDAEIAGLRGRLRNAAAAEGEHGGRPAGYEQTRNRCHGAPFRLRMSAGIVRRKPRYGTLIYGGVVRHGRETAPLIE